MYCWGNLKGFDIVTIYNKTMDQDREIQYLEQPYERNCSMKYSSILIVNTANVYWLCKKILTNTSNDYTYSK